MKNSLSEELAYVELKSNELNVIGIIKYIPNSFLTDERFADVVYSNSEQ